MLSEVKTPELTSEEIAFTAGYQAAEVNWYSMVRKGLTLEQANTYNNEVAYDEYISAMAKHFLKD